MCATTKKILRNTIVKIYIISTFFLSSGRTVRSITRVGINAGANFSISEEKLKPPEIAYTVYYMERGGAERVEIEDRDLRF